MQPPFPSARQVAARDGLVARATQGEGGTHFGVRACSPFRTVVSSEKFKAFAVLSVVKGSSTLGSSVLNPSSNVT